jgi:hypothetical protein
MHRSFNRPVRIWLLPLLGVLAIIAFPAAAGAATPAATPCATPPVGTSPCYTVAPAVSPASEWTNPPEGRILTVSLTPPQTGSPGTWSGTAPIKYTYQWQDCDAATGLTCTAISGATSRTYTVAPTDVGSRLQFIVKATNSAGTGYAVLESTGAAVGAVPIDRVAPSISGPSQDGQTVTGNPGSWMGTQPITYTYQWRHCDANGKNCDPSSKWFPATPSSSAAYVLRDTDLGHTMSVVVTATNSAGHTVQGSFATTNVVTPGNTALPKISGAAQEGKTLTESNGAWLPSNSTRGYQWESCDASGGNCSAIARATAQTYKLTSADVGHTMVVQETASQSGVNSTPASSAPTGVVQGASSSTGGGQGGSQGGGQGGSQGGGQGGSQGGSQGSGSSASGVTAAQLRRLLRNAMAVHGKGARIGALLKHGGYSFTFAAPSPGALQISWYRRVHGQRILIARTTVLFRKTGKTKVELLLTSRGRTLLKGASRMTLAAQGGFTPVGRRATSASTTITLKG